MNPPTTNIKKKFITKFLMFFVIFFVLNVTIFLMLVYVYRPVLIVENGFFNSDFLKVISIPFLLALVPTFFVKIHEGKVKTVLIVLFYFIYYLAIKFALTPLCCSVAG